MTLLAGAVVITAEIAYALTLIAVLELVLFSVVIGQHVTSFWWLAFWMAVIVAVTGGAVAFLSDLKNGSKLSNLFSKPASSARHVIFAISVALLFAAGGLHFGDERAREVLIDHQRSCIEDVFVAAHASDGDLADHKKSFHSGDEKPSDCIRYLIQDDRR